jgi:hypothetical protein
MRTTIKDVPLAIARATALSRAQADALLDELRSLTASLESAVGTSRRR